MQTVQQKILQVEPAYLSVLLVRYTNDGCVDNIHGAEKTRLEDVWRDLVHPKMDHVLDFLDEVDHSLGIVVAYVPSPEEALLVEILLGVTNMKYPESRVQQNKVTILK